VYRAPLAAAVRLASAICEMSCSLHRALVFFIWKITSTPVRVVGAAQFSPLPSHESGFS
jgi:hypothetical protein